MGGELRRKEEEMEEVEEEEEEEEEVVEKEEEMGRAGGGRGRAFQLDGANSDPEFILSISARWSGKELGSSALGCFAVLTLYE
ncbi:hypothetical protein V1477_001931 [Vespula maculifrons]|uniref:Uncharacterized protein n=1 Tax=Vespula maculifrons TaxID=7453 RepID=A0ABD2CZ07_VESMC